jgi:hypothetical protein
MGALPPLIAMAKEPKIVIDEPHEVCVVWGETCVFGVLFMCLYALGTFVYVSICEPHEVCVGFFCGFFGVVLMCLLCSKDPMYMYIHIADPVLVYAWVFVCMYV